jgi:DNA gyrase inhibitor GyrI
VRIDTVDFPETEIVYGSASGTPDAIPEAAGRAFAVLEAAIPPRGRKVFGYWHPPALEYRACYARKPGDAPETLGLATGVIEGGPYRRARLAGEDVYSQIPGAFAALEGSADLASDGRPWFESYRRHDEVDLHVPIAAAG